MKTIAYVFVVELCPGDPATAEAFESLAKAENACQVIHDLVIDQHDGADPETLTFERTVSDDDETVWTDDFGMFCIKRIPLSL